MSKRNMMKKTAAVALGAVLAVGATGCNFFPTNSEKDYAQTIAKVNISETLKNDDKYSAQTEGVSKLIKEGILKTEITKKELVSSFLSTGYNYVNSGYSYEDTFNMLMDALVGTKIITQHAVAYYLENVETLSADGCIEYVNAKLDKNADANRQ